MVHHLATFKLANGTIRLNLPPAALHQSPASLQIWYKMLVGSRTTFSKWWKMLDCRREWLNKPKSNGSESMRIYQYRNLRRRCRSLLGFVAGAEPFVQRF